MDNVLRCAQEADDDEAGRIDRESLRAYLRACGQIWSGDPGEMSNDEVRTLLRRIVKRNPRFAHGWAELARASEIEAHDLPPDQAAPARQEAWTAAERALRLDPKIAVAYVALADMIPAAHHLGEREDLVEKGLSLAPDHASLNHRQAWLLAQAGRLRESLAYTQRCEALDPLRPDFARELALLLAGEGRLAEAREMIDRAAQTWPDDDDVRGARIEFEARYGAPDRAIGLLDDPRSRPATWENPVVDDWRRFILARRSRDPAQVGAYARDVLARLAAGRMDLSDAVLRLNSLGATDGAFAAIARSPPTDAFDTEVLFATSPGGAGMWRDPRFMPLAAKLGLVDFWRRSGKWPDFCDAPDRPYDCRTAIH
jgi:tetratricopeptide (TPR) repeat protein